MNIVAFSRSTYSRRASSFYLLYASIFDFLYLFPKSLLNILQYGFYYDWTMNSNFLCKIQIYFIYVLTITSGALTVLANIDRYLLSSNNSKRWNYSSRSVAKHSIKLTILFWFIISIPIFICSKRSSYLLKNEKLICSNSSKDRFCLLDGFIPPFIMMIFGLMTFKNVHHLYHRSRTKSTPTRRINHQITLMFVLQSIKSAFTSFPYSIFNSYLLITKSKGKSLLQQAKENLVMEIVYLLFWSNYTSFFVYFLSSDIFRNEWRKGMKKILLLNKNQNN